MAAETTSNISHAVQLNECIPGSLVDAAPKGITENNALSKDLKNYEAGENEQPEQDDISQTDVSDIDNMVLFEAPDVLCKEQVKEYKASLEESDEVAILQEVQYEVSKLGVSGEADLYQEELEKQSGDTTQQEDATQTEGDNNNTKETEEYDDEKAVTPQKHNAQDSEGESEGLDVEINQKDSAGQNGDETVANLKEQALNLASDDEDCKELNDPHGPHQEHPLSKTKPLLQDEASESSFSPKDAIAQNIQQGELLLYRLHLVQQNQEMQQVSDGQPASNTAAMVMTKDTIENVTVMPDTKVEDDGERERDLSWRVETTEKPESEEERDLTEAKSEEEWYNTSLAETGHHKEAKMEKEVSDDDQSDSGVSADFFPGGIYELPASYSQNVRPVEETPVQREIRQGLEREKTLRQSRGLDDWDGRSQELVEIPTKRSLEAPQESSGTNFSFDAEKRLAKRKMLQDINLEAMKEQALKKLGQAPGFCGIGHGQDVKERHELFDAFHQCKKTDTQDSSRFKKFFSYSFTAGDAEKRALQGDSLPFVSVLERTRSLEMFTTNYQFKDSTAPLRGTESDKAPDTDCQFDSHKECLKKTKHSDATLDTQSKQCSSISLSSLDWDSGTMASNMDNEKEDEGDSILKRNNPFFQLRPALSLRPDVEKEIREAMKREQELRRLRSRLYGGQENNLGDKQEGKAQSTCVESSSAVSDHVYRGKLSLIWPPPSSKVEEESGSPKPTGQRPALQHRWETSVANSSCNEKD